MEHILNENENCIVTIVFYVWIGYFGQLLVPKYPCFYWTSKLFLKTYDYLSILPNTYCLKYKHIISSPEKKRTVFQLHSTKKK